MKIPLIAKLRDDANNGMIKREAFYGAMLDEYGRFPPPWPRLSSNQFNSPNSSFILVFSRYCEQGAPR